MAYIYDDNVIFDVNENRIAFLMDSPDDIPSLPTTTSPGSEMAPNNVSCEPVDAGSVAFAISTSRVYMLDSNDEWVLQPEKGGGGGGGGATTLADLEDVTIAAPINDGDFLVYSPLVGGWVNKKAETVIVNYEMVNNKPTINGTEVDGDLTLEDIGVNTMTNEQMADLLALLDF